MGFKQNSNNQIINSTYNTLLDCKTRLLLDLESQHPNDTKLYFPNYYYTFCSVVTHTKVINKHRLLTKNWVILQIPYNPKIYILIYNLLCNLAVFTYNYVFNLLKKVLNVWHTVLIFWAMVLRPKVQHIV